MQFYALGILLLLWHGAVVACSCAEPRPSAQVGRTSMSKKIQTYAQYHTTNSSIVVRAKVIGHLRVPKLVSRPYSRDQQVIPFAFVDDSTDLLTNEPIEFSILEVLKGVVPQGSIIVRDANIGTSCAAGRLKVDEEWLLFFREQDFYLRACNGNVELSNERSDSRQYSAKFLTAVRKVLRKEAPSFSAIKPTMQPTKREDALK